jgi:type VI secretion system secreted protein Hcp
MAMDMFIKIGDIKGESRDKAHKGEIDVLAWSWGVINSGSAGSGGGAGSGKASSQDLTFTKYIDVSSPDLLVNCFSGKHFDKATLVVRKAGQTPLEYLTVNMEEVIITGVKTGGTGGSDRLTENVTLNFAKVGVEYKEQEKSGSGKPANSMTWDIAANTK